MASPFIFKHFKLEQSLSAFKLGTDSVLLGAWMPEMNYQEILDIGGGTGIISLMMAQRFDKAKIISVEVDQGSVTDMANNFTQSKWSSRLQLVHSSIIEWSNLHSTQKFDLIITNPPYFTNDLQNPDPRKANARHTGELRSESMAKLLQQHLDEKGKFACILPALEFDQWTAILDAHGIYLNQICLISSFSQTPVVRKMGVFSQQKGELRSEDQFIYNADKSRSDWYAGITSEFYIK